MPDISNITVLSSKDKPRKRILFLGYNREQTKLIDALIGADCEVHHTEGPIGIVGYDLIVSFGYRHILRKNLIEGVGCPIINLHISYLPYNRGAHPNFWSFYENTPSGVSIHLIDEGIDTGPLIYQKYVNFDAGEITFAETYKRLFEEIENLFLENLELILNDQWEAKPQRGKGTSHLVRDLPEEFNGWGSAIETEIARLDKTQGETNGA